MRIGAFFAAAMLVGHVGNAEAQSEVRPSGPLQQRIAPGMAAYTDDVLFGQVWPGSGLSQRDRSLVVISVLIATNKPEQLKGHLDRALSNGVTPTEASGVLTHLALYSGWPSAVSALAVYDEVYKTRNVDLGELSVVTPKLPAKPFDPARAQAMDSLKVIAPLFTRLTDEIVFDDLWRRADLSLRDRSLVTIVALAAMGEADQLPTYLNRGVDAGLTGSQVGEALTQLAFYAGWPRATAALEVASETLRSAAGEAAAPAATGSSNFTGSVSVTKPFQGSGGARLGGATVVFAPAARSKWHSHPLGQLLIATAGRGWAQIEGEAVQSLEPGDVYWTPPGTKHWHGATRDSGFVHVAVSEDLEGAEVRWFEPVSDLEFQGPQ
jgi:4-carboxymuconolactone decarboxylase